MGRIELRLEVGRKTVLCPKTFFWGVNHGFALLKSLSHGGLRKVLDHFLQCPTQNIFLYKPIFKSLAIIIIVWNVSSLNSEMFNPYPKLLILRSQIRLWQFQPSSDLANKEARYQMLGMGLKTHCLVCHRGKDHSDHHWNANYKKREREKRSLQLTLLQKKYNLARKASHNCSSQSFCILLVFLV